MLKAFGRSTSGVHARPRKRVRFCCSVKPSQLWWGLLPICTINEIFRTIPRKPPTHLPPLSKVRCCRPKKFGRLPEGLPHHHPSPLTNPSQNRTIPCPAPPHLPFNERSVCFASLPRQPLVPLHRIPPLPKTTINPKRKALKRSPVAKTGNGDSVLYIGFTLSICPHLQQAQRFRVRDYPSSQAYILRPKFRLFRRCRQASAYSCYRLSCRLRSACRYLYGR